MRKTLFSILLIILSIACFTGCSSNEEPASVSIVYSNRANCPLPNFNNETISSVREEVAKTFGSISAICIDGNPEIVGTVTYEDIPDNVKDAGSSKIKKDAIARINSFINTISNCTANDDEADLLESLRLAVRSLTSNVQTENKTIVVLDSGLSTTGLLNFNNNILQANADRIAEALSEKDAIPDFTGCKVFFVNLGDTREPQKKLSPQQLKHLGEIWQAIIEKGGGEFHTAESLPGSDKTNCKYPTVSAVELPEEQPITYTGSSDLDVSTPVTIGEDQVKFIGDSDEYVDEDDALKSIKPLATYLNKNKDISILLVGTTAGDSNNNYTISLSNRRALTVKNTLVSLGVSSKRITTIGLGCNDPWHIAGVGTEGSMASQNRKVVMIDANSEMARKICK